MAAYGIYRISNGSNIEDAEWLEAVDDTDAVRKVRDLNMRAVAWELWQEERLVAKAIVAPD